MWWFLCTLLTILCWGGADLFYKLGSDSRDKWSHLKIVVMVGLVMGLHGAFYLVTTGISFDPMSLLRYFPVSFFYIVSMTVGYAGLRYLELSISSPVQNSSGAVTAILCCILFVQTLSGLEIFGVALVCAGVLALAVLEKRMEDQARALRQEATDRRHTVGALALLFPIGYCILDAAGTFLDAVYLGEAESEARFGWLSRLLSDFQVMEEGEALLAYEFTFFLCGVLAYLFLRFVKRQRFHPLREPVRGGAALLETAGQFFYVFAMSGRAVVAAPLIASYSIVSLLLSRLFLKERLTKAQYAVILVILSGIAILGFCDV